MQTDTNMELISTAGCPYAQRKEIVLAAKSIDARIREIDFKAPPEEFLARSPLAKVPVLVHGDESPVESTVINEYLDEVIPVMPLRPNDPALRARMRFLVALGFMDSIYFRDPLSQRIELASYKVEPPPGVLHGQVLLAAHRIRVADGEDHIEDRHVAAALRSLVAETQESLSHDRGPKKAYVERVEEP